jgi:hypothetical protein
MDRVLTGNDWDNLLTLYPRVLFDPMDARVTATLHKTRQEYVEGVLRYVHPQAVGRNGDSFVFNEEATTHYWQTPNNSEASLVRGTPEDQQWAVRELYALLLHTTSTHLPAEWGTVPWSTRGVSSTHNLLPQGATSGKTIELLRNMLVREEGKDLYFYSAISPAWIGAGKKLGMTDEPTTFGPVSAELESTEEGMRISMNNHFRQNPQRVIVRIPWFYELAAATADGKAVKASGTELVVAPETKEILLRGRVKPGTSEVSYDNAVEEYKQEYQRRYRHFVQSGERER